MQNGIVAQVLYTDKAEQEFAHKVSRLDDILCKLRDKIRMGERFIGTELEELA